MLEYVRPPVACDSLEGTYTIDLEGCEKVYNSPFYFGVDPKDTFSIHTNGKGGLDKVVVLTYQYRVHDDEVDTALLYYSRAHYTRFMLANPMPAYVEMLTKDMTYTDIDQKEFMKRAGLFMKELELILPAKEV